MPAENLVDPTLPDDLARSLARSSAAVLDASDELLAHYGDTGDAPTQASLDALIDKAADALRALALTLADTACQVPAATLHQTTTHNGDAGESCLPSDRRLDH